MGGAQAFYDTVYVALDTQDPGYGSGRAMLALALASTSAIVTSSATGESIDLTFEVSLDPSRRPQGEMWVDVPTDPAHRQPEDMDDFAYVPVAVSARFSDGRLAIPSTDALLATGEIDRAGIDFYYSGPLAGPLNYESVPTIDPPCEHVRIWFDFREQQPPRVSLRFMNELEMPCATWSTADPPVFWRTFVGVPH
jgi:hypothetical protein